MSVQSHDCEPSSSSSSTSERSPPILPCGDLERNFASLQISIEARLKELEIKEARVNERLRELDSREAKIRSHSVPDPNSSGTTDAKKFLNVLSESASEHETLRERVRRALWDFGDPGKLALEAIGNLYGVDSGKRKGVVLLLEQLAEIGPSIGPVERAEAARLAREWRARILEEDFDGRSGVSEVLGFLLLIGAYDLVDEFDSGDVFGVFRCIRRSSLRSTGEDSNADFGWGDNDEQDSPANTIPNPQEEDYDKDSPASATSNPRKRRGTKGKTLSLEEDLELVNQIASAFTSTFEALQSFCVGMDGRNLKLFLYQYVEDHDSWGSEVREALTYSPDPAKLVLDSVPGFLRSQPEFHKSLTMAKVRKSCILLLEQLISIAPPISQSVGEEALKLAKEWGSNLGQVYQRPVIVYGFLLLLAAYRLGSIYDREELLRLLGIASQYKAYPGLCRALGFADEVLIESLVKKMMLLEAVDNVCACGLASKFQPVRLLKDYLKFSRKRIYKKGDQSSLQQKQAINKEITAIKTVIKYITKYKLESTYPPGRLEKQISQLEIKKGKINDSADLRKPHTDPKSSTAPNSSVPRASNTVDSEPKVEPSVKEELPSDNHPVQPEQDGRAEKDRKSPTVVSNVPSNSPWPLLESFCINLYGEGFNILSQKIKEEEIKEEPNSTVSSSSSSSTASLWPELKHLCMNMDGEGLRTFVYSHIDREKNESLRSEVRNALKDASYPAKLVLDAMPGCLRTQPEFDGTLNINKVRNTRILLLEELITISPLIGPLVREKSAKMANDWRGNIGFKYKGPDNVFGFLHFLAAYGLMSDFEADELLGLLGHANQHRACPGLCQILGFADKASVVIANLIQMNLVVEAVEHIYAFEVENYSPPLLLKEYVKSIKVRFDGTKPPAKKAIEQEIVALRRVIDCVTKYKLESELPPHHLVTRIIKLEKKTLAVLDPKKVIPPPNVRA